ncbi:MULTISPECIES: hypothetical protein [Flavobacteriaceae]|uniref:hypothetical protein n=1 Tax=Flavobacteriaceae TaxID=49546 RepID=UPI001CE1045B|nr:hypothetical protein [Salegentibacter mishustinae]UBZ05623.1 hypothetical protein LDL76_09585 [Salegentibacter mishustinae]
MLIALTENRYLPLLFLDFHYPLWVILPRERYSTGDPKTVLHPDPEGYIKMEGYAYKTEGIIGKATLTFIGEFYGAF